MKRFALLLDGAPAKSGGAPLLYHSQADAEEERDRWNNAQGHLLPGDRAWAVAVVDRCPACSGTGKTPGAWSPVKNGPFFHGGNTCQDCKGNGIKTNEATR